LGFQNPWRWLQKFVYLRLVNRDPIHASGLHLLTRFAERRMRYLFPGYQEPTMVQGNLVNVPNLADLPTASKSDYALPEDAFVLVFLGRLDVWVKGLDILVEAFSCLPSDRSHLVLVGPDWQNGRAKLEQLGDRFGCKDRMRFTGPLYGATKWSVLRMADLFVSPSRWEAFSIAQAEAMAIGLPVVTTTKVSLALELRNADAALLIPPRAELLAKALTTLEADAEQRQTLGKRGKAWMESNCDPARAGDRFLEFYQSVLERNQAAKG
jgi:glycosyltransferase involved in cell wall biosynthesis